MFHAKFNISRTALEFLVSADSPGRLYGGPIYSEGIGTRVICEVCMYYVASTPILASSRKLVVVLLSSTVEGPRTGPVPHHDRQR